MNDEMGATRRAVYFFVLGNAGQIHVIFCCRCTVPFLTTQTASFARLPAVFDLVDLARLYTTRT